MPVSRACWSLIPPVSYPFIVCTSEQHIWSSHEVPGLPMGGQADQPEPCPYGSSLLGSLRQIVLVLLALHSTFLEAVHPSLWCPNPWPQCFLGVVSTSRPLMVARWRWGSRYAGAGAVGAIPGFLQPSHSFHSSVRKAGSKLPPLQPGSWDGKSWGTAELLTRALSEKISACCCETRGCLLPGKPD